MSIIEKNNGGFMISIATLQGNVVNFSRSAWLASLGAIATVSQESRQIVEKISQWNIKESVAGLENQYRQVFSNIKDSLGNLFNNMSVPRFATVS
jgi:hypothetical protein